MKIFLDSANLQELEYCLKRGILRGITTNPSIISKEPKTDFFKHIQKMADLCKSHRQNLPLSVEIFTPHPHEMFAQAQEVLQKVDYENINIKIPIGWGELEVIHQLAKEKIPVNCTCLFNEAQCMLAANAGAKYVSIFMGRLKDIGADPLPTITNVRKMLDAIQSPAEIIVGSIRHPRDISDAQIAGAHIVTASMKFFETMAGHPQTSKSVQGFLDDFKHWMSTASN
ncbi:MAG: fructose-6-phosphate aldolase [Verrucomicrobia bacterium]|nr:fructose-6-phosphate aldolase [Verrucomicrobiota bacterium]